MAESLQAMREARLAALSRSAGASANTPPPSSHPAPQQQPNAAYSRAPPVNQTNRSQSNNIHTLSSSRSGSGTRLAASSRTQTVTQTHELYVRLPSKEITSEQLVQFIKCQFNINASIRYMNTKNQSYQMNDRNFCFVECDSRADMERLIEEMNDTTIGDWEDPIMVKEKLDHPPSG